MNLIERAKQTLLSPKSEWEVIDAEQTTTAELYKDYIVPLAANGPVAQIIGTMVVGIMGYRPAFVAVIAGSLVGYVLTLVGTYILALIIDVLAPNFRGRRNQIQALKVAAYSSTALWVAGIFWLIPALWVLMLLGFFYSFYLLYLGLPKLMKSPVNKALGYTIGVVIAAFVVFVIINTISTQITGRPWRV
jgi:hypothetical protein